MPRIRTIKPEIWDSSDFMDLPAVGQLTFIALISLADDHGRLRADARHLHLVALRGIEPGEVAAQLEAMERLAMVRCYTVEGRSYIQVSNWAKHQKVDHPKDSVHPPPPPEKPRERSRRVAKNREKSRGVETSRAPADRIEDLGKDLGPEGIEDQDLLPAPSGNQPPAHEDTLTLPSGVQIKNGGNGAFAPTEEELTLVKRYVDVTGNQPSPSDVIKAREFLGELRYLDIGGMVDSIARHVARRREAKQPWPRSLGGFWKVLRADSDYARDHGTRERVGVG